MSSAKRVQVNNQPKTIHQSRSNTVAMTPEELTEVVNIHQKIMSRHDEEIAAIRGLIKLAVMQHRDDLAAIHKLAEKNQEQLNTLTTGLLELRQLIAEDIKKRSNQ